MQCSGYILFTSSPDPTTNRIVTYISIKTPNSAKNQVVRVTIGKKYEHQDPYQSVIKKMEKKYNKSWIRGRAINLKNTPSRNETAPFEELAQLDIFDIELLEQTYSEKMMRAFEQYFTFRSISEAFPTAKSTRVGFSTSRVVPAGVFQRSLAFLLCTDVKFAKAKQARIVTMEREILYLPVQGQTTPAYKDKPYTRIHNARLTIFLGQDQKRLRNEKNQTFHDILIAESYPAIILT